MKVEDIARVAHLVNKAYCEAMGDFSQLGWDEAPAWQKESSARGVKFALDNPGLTAADQHAAWMRDKLADGWGYGFVKDPITKKHNCLVPYLELPPAQRAKDHLFRAVVKSLTKHLEDEHGLPS